MIHPPPRVLEQGSYDPSTGYQPKPIQALSLPNYRNLSQSLPSSLLLMVCFSGSGCFPGKSKSACSRYQRGGIMKPARDSHKKNSGFRDKKNLRLQSQDLKGGKCRLPSCAFFLGETGIHMGSAPGLKRDQRIQVHNERKWSLL